MLRDDDSVSFGRWVTLVLLAFALFMAAVLATGCAHCPKCVPEIKYVQVEVPVPIPCPTIQPPAAPRWVDAEQLTPQAMAEAILRNFSEALRHYVESRKGGSDGSDDSRANPTGPGGESVGTAR